MWLVTQFLTQAHENHKSNTSRVTRRRPGEVALAGGGPGPARWPERNCQRYQSRSKKPFSKEIDNFLTKILKGAVQRPRWEGS